MNAAIQIAKHLEVSHWQVVKTEEWAKVWFAVVKGLGARFVSKKVVKMADKLSVDKIKKISSFGQLKTYNDQMNCQIWFKKTPQVIDKIKAVNLGEFDQLFLLELKDGRKTVMVARWTGELETLAGELCTFGAWDEEATHRIKSVVASGMWKTSDVTRVKHG